MKKSWGIASREAPVGTAPRIEREELAVKWKVWFLRIGVAAMAGATLLGLSRTSGAQEAPDATLSGPRVEQQQSDKDVLAALREMQAQMKALNARLGEVSTAQADAAAEARELRTELASANARIHILESTGNISSPPVDAYAPPQKSEDRKVFAIETQSPGNGETLEERLGRIEENAQLLDSKLTGQDQSKVDSGAKYRLRLSGIFLFNLYGNAGNVNNQDFPEVAAEPGLLGTDHAFGGSLRQSQIGLEAFGPDLAGAHTSANLRFDFSGATLQEGNGALMGGVRLRTGTFRMDWANTSLIAGQDFLFFAPLAPTSLATIATPAMSYSGNLWAWTPQVRIEHRFALTQSSTIAVAGGILDQATGDVPDGGQDRAPSWGEQSGQPGYAGRIGWERKTSVGILSLGGGGYYGLENWGFNRSVNSWAALVDLRIPLNRYFEFSGQFYRGQGIGGFGAGLGESVLFGGSPSDPASAVKGLNSMGGWAQMKYKARTNLEFNAALGQENPFSADIRAYPFQTSVYDQALAKNQSWFVNFIYQPKSNILFSLEYRRLKTREIGGDEYPDNHLNLSLGYQF